MTSDLKYQLLQWLYEKYSKHPTHTWDIAPFLSGHGLNNEAEVIDYGYAMKNTGLIKEYSGCTIDSFNAAINMKGIDFISDDVHNEMLQLLSRMVKTANKPFSVLKQLKYLPQLYPIALDLGLYMQSLELARLKIEEAGILLQVTNKGMKWADPNSPDYAGSHHRMIA